MKSPQQVYILDTTLRDGQQAPGAGMSFEDNLSYAQHAHNLGVDILDAGFPASSQTDFDIVHTISKNLTAEQSPVIIAALCQLRENQLPITMKALEPSLKAKKARVYIYTPISPALMQASLGKLANDTNTIINRIRSMVSTAHKAGYAVQFSLEGFSEIGSNTELGLDLCRAAIDSGASVISCPDTIGSSSTWQGEHYFVHTILDFANQIQKEFPHRNITWAAHCHNDLGFALENSLQAVFKGPARQIEGCINGIGERAGNVALEQCIMAIQQFGKTIPGQSTFFTRTNSTYLKTISNFVADKMLIRQPHQPIVGDNIARHSSGGHTRALLKDPTVYHAFDPNTVGQTLRLTFGPLSGSNLMQSILQSRGFYCNPKDKITLAQLIKDKYADQRKQIPDDAVIETHHEFYAPIKCTNLTYRKNKSNEITLQIYGQFFNQENLEITTISENSAIALLNEAVNQHFPYVEIEDYRSQACSEKNANSPCRSTVIIQIKKRSYIGKATESDLNISALKAYINAINHAYIDCHYRMDHQTK